ncbi:MAG: hypothetical protein DYH04_07285 [Nitrospira sp. NTP2]|nr:hypothetical protein [Nitrospira sp. NTP2]
MEQLADTVVTLFPNALAEYAHLGRSIYQARHEAGEFSAPPPARRPMGRNEARPCGSGRTFKKCCGAS